MKYLVSLLFALSISLTAATTARAASEFSTSYHSLYNFTSTGSAQITHTIELTNNLAHIYPTVYNLALSSSNLQNIQVKVDDTLAKPEIELSANLTTIHIPIANPQIGKDQKTKLTITYETLSFAEVIGNTYTLTLPKTAKGNEATSFVRDVLVPLDYPELSYSSISPQSIDSSTADSRSYRFVGSGDQSLTLHFGVQSSATLTLDYLLKNTTSSTAISELALPPDTPYQQVVLEKIEPEPNEIVLDSDGNWLARYPLDPTSQKEVKATLTLTLSPTPRYFDPSTSSPLGEQPYWEQSSQIKRLATQLKNPRNLYDYLLNNLTYDYAQIAKQQRLGADRALSNPSSAICTEFTDLFVATSRAMGIPSRAIIGYAITNNESLRPQGSKQDILHAYPEYLDPETKRWLAVDPTWGHTTGGSEYFTRLDFGHIAFVRLGTDSSYPLPAGSYRSQDSPKQVNLSINPNPVEPPPAQYQVVEIEGHSYLKNTGQVALVQAQIELDSQKIFVPYLPPYGQMPLAPPTTPALNRYYLFPLALILVGLIYLTWRRLWRHPHRE